MENKPLESYHKPVEKLELSGSQQSAIKISCPACNGPVKASNLNINDKIAKCGSCDSVFSFEQEVQQLLTISPSKQEVAKPAGVDLYHFHDDLEISLEQALSPLDVILAAFSAIFFILFVLIYFLKGDFFWGLPISVITGAYGFYQMANRHKHFIYIDVTDRFLNVKWRPKKFHHDISVPTSELSQLYVKFSTTSNQATLYGILDTAEGQKHVKLLPEIPGLTKARYLEQEIERHLGIVDEVVPEETR